jgi:hypothetical protein
VGIGFVLVAWAFLMAVVATPVLVVLLVVAKRTGGRARAKRVFRWVAIAAPITAAYVGACFLGYAFWCSEVRGVDPGIGDWASVPLGYGFALSFIDASHEAFILERYVTDEGVPLEYGITQVGQSGPYVYGLVAADSAFVLDTRSGTLQRTSRPGLPNTLRDIGVVDMAVAPVNDFYMARRWGWPDLVAAAGLVLPVLLFGWRSGRRAWTGPGRDGA